MAIIAFWSNTPKETAQTLSMIAIASHMAVEENSKILIIDTNFNDNTIKNAYFKEKATATTRMIKELSGKKIDLGSGIEGLAQLLASGKDAGNLIPNYTKTVFKGRLEVIVSSNATSNSEKGRIYQTYKSLLKLADQQYDYVFVDMEKGLENPNVVEMLQIADVVVCNITQRLIDMDDYINLKKNDQSIKAIKLLPLIGRYDRYSKYTKKNVARYIGEKKDIPAISYNTLFWESANEAEIGNYFLKFRKSLISNTDRNAIFVDEVENATQRLILKVQEIQLMN